MSHAVLMDARRYLTSALQGKINKFENRHGWRKGWEFAVLHSLRVEDYLLRILVLENHSLSERDIVLLRLAAILHDVVRLDVRVDHARIGAEAAGRWLWENTALTTFEIERVVEWIAAHSNKNSGEQDFCKAVLQDADTLDEIGIMSIFMTSSWLDNQSPFFFYDLRRRLIENEIPTCEKTLAFVNTDGARTILREKMAFIENFIHQLDNELKSDAQVAQLLDGTQRT